MSALLEGIVSALNKQAIMNLKPGSQSLRVCIKLDVLCALYIPEAGAALHQHQNRK